MDTKRLLMVVCLLIMAFAGSTAFAQDGAQVRFVHTFVDAPDVDIYINGEVIAEEVTFGTASDYIDVATGDIEVSVNPAGESDSILTQTVTTSVDPVTLVISNANGFIPYVDNVDSLGVGEARITAIHAIDGGPVVDVILTDGRPVIPQLEFGVPFGTLDLPVIKLPLNVVPAGGEVTDALLPEPYVFAPTTGTSYMVVIYGEVDDPQTLLLSTPVNPNPGDGFLQLTHDVADGPVVDVFAGENLIATGLAEGTSTTMFPVPAGDYDVQVTATDTTDVIVEANLTIAQSAETTAVVELDGEDVVITVETAEDEAPQVAEEETEAEVVEEPSEEAEVVAAQPTEAPAVAEEVVPATQPEVVEAQPAAPAGVPTARVIIDAGSNIQLRQYPDENALSLGLAPSGATLQVNGREGAPVQIEGLFSEEIQREIDAYEDPAEDLDENQDLNEADTWLNVTYNTPDGGTIEAWTIAQFLSISAPDGTNQRIADLPTIPSNAFGEAANTEVAPPEQREDAVTAVVFNLNPGVNLKIRRTPSTDGETLSLIQAGTVLELLGFGISGSGTPGVEEAEDADWAFIRYVTPEGAETTGWVSTQYIQYQWRGDSIDFEEMEARSLLLFEDTTTRGELGAGAAPVEPEPVDPLEDQFVATVAIDAGANLQFRRDPAANSESLGLIPSGTQLIVTARDSSGDWLFVEFEGVTGWIATDFVDLTFNDAPADIDELEVDG